MQALHLLVVVIAGIAPFLVLINFFAISSLLRKANRFERVLAKYENRERTRLQNDTMEALSLLQSGKTDEARRIAEKIATS